jgi:hypothetical protein
MGGALIGSVTYQEIYAFLSLGMSAINDPVSIYVRIIKGIDSEYVAIKQKKIDDETSKASKTDKSKSKGKNPIKSPAAANGASKALPHNID